MTPRRDSCCTEGTQRAVFLHRGERRDWSIHSRSWAVVWRASTCLHAVFILPRRRSMDSGQFDDLSRVFAHSRRSAVTALLGVAGILGGTSIAEAKKKRKKKRKKKH